MENEKQPTIQDILFAVSEFANDTKKRFDGIELKIDNLAAEIQGVKAELEKLRIDLEKLAKTTQEDTGALAKNFIDLENRIKRIEEHLRLQPAL